MIISLKTLQLVMKHGYAVMTLKLNNHNHNGLHLHHHGHRKCTKFGAKQMLMLSLFLIKNALFTITVLHQAKLQTMIFI